MLFLFIVTTRANQLNSISPSASCSQLAPPRTRTPTVLHHTPLSGFRKISKATVCFFVGMCIMCVYVCNIPKKIFYTAKPPTHKSMYRAINPSSIHIQSTSFAAANLIVASPAATFAISFAPAFPWPSLMAKIKAPCQALL